MCRVSMDINFGGDLFDVIRASGVETANDWLLPPFDDRIEPDPNLFGDPFSDTRDPLLHEIIQTELPRPVHPDPTGSPISTRPQPPQNQISPLRNTGVKRRKSQVKKVVCVPAPAPATSRPSSGEVVPSDLWAWRKYGQKPIKGSPYPRGYYRCSSSKGCSARKQVERSRTDPNMLVITYTSEHNHPWPTQRNALAGSTRSHLYKSNATSKGLSEKLSKEDVGKDEGSVEKSLGEEHEVIMNMDASVNEQSYRPASPVHTDKDCFAELGEFESDPLSLLMAGGIADSQVEKDGNSLDPFSFFDWTTNYTSSHGDGESGV